MDNQHHHEEFDAILKCQDCVAKAAEMLASNRERMWALIRRRLDIQVDINVSHEGDHDSRDK